MKKVVLILLSFVFFSCSGNKILEEVTASYPDGNKKDVVYYKLDKDGNRQNVKEASYYEEGMLHLEGPIVNGKRNGTFKSYYKSGQLMSVGEFLGGKRVGKAETYYENGKLRYEGFYENGKECGIWKFYDEQGNFEYEINKDLR